MGEYEYVILLIATSITTIGIRARTRRNISLISGTSLL